MGKPIGKEATDAHRDGVNGKVLDALKKMGGYEFDSIHAAGGLPAVRARCLEIIAAGVRKSRTPAGFAKRTGEMFSHPSDHAIARRYGFEGADSDSVDTETSRAAGGAE